MDMAHNDDFQTILAATGHLHPTGTHRRELLAQNGLLAVERVRDPIVVDAIVVSIGERARVMRAADFRTWLDEVRHAFDACSGAPASHNRRGGRRRDGQR